jgi:hypothetical protein
MVDLILEYRFKSSHELMWLYTQLKNSELPEVKCDLDFDIQNTSYNATVTFQTNIALPLTWYKRLFFSDYIKRNLRDVTIGKEHTDLTVKHLFTHGGNSYESSLLTR